MIAINVDGAVLIYDTNLNSDGNFSTEEKFNWKKIDSFNDEKIVSAIWKDATTVFFGGENSLYEYNINKANSISAKKKLCITALKDFSWSPSGKVIGKSSSNNNDEILEYEGILNWKSSKETQLQYKKTTNSSERIYIDTSTGYFKNMIYVRNLKDFTTKPLFDLPSRVTPKLASNVNIMYENNSLIFSNGNRNGKKQLALVFDAMSDMDGIAEIIFTLKKNNIKASFFINGEAMLQNPKAINEIVNSGFQCGSLFFTTWNLNSTEYTLDEKFIRQGLARNEDIFYATTGKELSLIWHSPNYIASSTIINAGKKAGYIFISPDIRIPDWITTNNNATQMGSDKTPAEMIEDICDNVRNGSIIPIRLGKTKPARNDYLYLKLQLLINALSELGYSFTDIEGLMLN